ncbi:MAG: hypothetical protein LC114_07335 [Bryobacterales bacterium]|nr:hypothetical protein [Bryobacterales bacterium]
MANFFDPATGAGITSLGIYKGTKFRLGLFGGGPNGERLVVTTSAGSGAALEQPDPAVRLVKDGTHKDWKSVYEIDSGKLRSSRVRACYNGGDYSSPVEIRFVTTQQIRTDIVTLARSFVGKAHYLWGTAGNVPGESNGNVGGGKVSAAQMRAYSLDLKEIARDKVLAVCTAVQPGEGYNTCAGRPRNHPQSLDVNEYLKRRQEDVAHGKTDQTRWEGAGPAKNLFPRKFHFRGQPQRGNTVVWGESCVGVRHFDCVGLVNYCYAKHWYQRGFGLDLAAFRNPNSGTFKVENEKDLMDADIVLKGNHHIGMLYHVGSNWFVAQAEETEVGLTDTAPYKSVEWERYRMRDAYLRSSPG